MNLLWSPLCRDEPMLVTINGGNRVAPLWQHSYKLDKCLYLIWNCSLEMMLIKNKFDQQLGHEGHFKSLYNVSIFYFYQMLDFHPVAQDRCTRSFLLPTWVLRHSKLVVESAAGDGLAGVWHWVVSCYRHTRGLMYSVYSYTHHIITACRLFKSNTRLKLVHYVYIHFDTTSWFHSTEFIIEVIFLFPQKIQ